MQLKLLWRRLIFICLVLGIISCSNPASVNAVSHSAPVVIASSIQQGAPTIQVDVIESQTGRLLPYALEVTNQVNQTSQLFAATGQVPAIILSPGSYAIRFTSPGHLGYIVEITVSQNGSILLCGQPVLAGDKAHIVLMAGHDRGNQDPSCSAQPKEYYNPGAHARVNLFTIQNLHTAPYHELPDRLLPPMLPQPVALPFLP